MRLNSVVIKRTLLPRMFQATANIKDNSRHGQIAANPDNFRAGVEGPRDLAYFKHGVKLS